MALINATAPIWSSEINQLGLRAGDVFDAYARSKKAALEQQRMLSHAYANPPIGKFLAPMPPRANRKLLLCQP